MAAAGAGDASQFLTRMMEDPARRKVLREQGRVALDRLYQPLFEQIDLKPPERDALAGMLLDFQFQLMEEAGPWLGKVEANGESPEALHWLQRQENDFAEDLKQTLGEQRYEKFRTYNASVQDRLAVNQFAEQLKANDLPLTDEQIQNLLRTIEEERQATRSAASDLADAMPSVRQLALLFSRNAKQRFDDAEEQLQQRVLERAKTILTSEQWEAYRTFQTKQREYQQMALELTRRMIGGGAASAPAGNITNEQP